MRAIVRPPITSRGVRSEVSWQDHDVGVPWHPYPGHSERSQLDKEDIEMVACGRWTLHLSIHVIKWHIDLDAGNDDLRDHSVRSDYGEAS